jgi:hypothetical protein
MAVIADHARAHGVNLNLERNQRRVKVRIPACPAADSRADRPHCSAATWHLPQPYTEKQLTSHAKTSRERIELDGRPDALTFRS